jgi:hypothetical protein
MGILLEQLTAYECHEVLLAQMTMQRHACAGLTPPTRKSRSLSQPFTPTSNTTSLTTLHATFATLPTHCSNATHLPVNLGDLAGGATAAHEANGAVASLHLAWDVQGLDLRAGREEAAA